MILGLEPYMWISQAQGLSSHALSALGALAAALSKEKDLSLVNTVLEDSLIRDLLEDAVDPAQHGGLAGSSARLGAATPVISAVSPLAFLHAAAPPMLRQ